MKLFDAHNHIQDERLRPVEDIIARCREAGVAAMVVNGTRPSDWPEIRALADRFSEVRASFGLHPWRVPEAPADWRERLTIFLDRADGVGEIGLDNWVRGADPAAQNAAFLWQWGQAAERDLPASVHCLKAWRRLLEFLTEAPKPRRGFLLHSYSGPAEMIPAFVKLGAYFSFSGHFLSERKAERREVFRRVPLDRWLVETDAPDMPLPGELSRFGSEAANHPANLVVVHEETAKLMGLCPETWADQLAENFARIFG